MLKDKIGSLLVEQKLITQEQLNQCLQEQKDTGKRLNALLLEHKFISKIDLAKVLAKQVGVEFIEKINERMVEPSLLGKVPLKFLRQHCIIPIIVENQRIIVTANPQDLQPLDDLALLMPGEVTYAVSTDDIINETINKYYPLETSKEMMEELGEESAEVEDFEKGGGPLEEKDIMEMANDAPIIILCRQPKKMRQIFTSSHSNVNCAFVIVLTATCICA